jgi:hypothetical protein
MIYLFKKKIYLYATQTTVKQVEISLFNQIIRKVGNKVESLIESCKRTRNHSRVW